jgi:hypothetical protein
VTETAVASRRSQTEIGAWITLATFAFAAVVGFIAVLDADSVGGAFGTGFGIALLVFLTGATVACGLACLARERLGLLALGSIVAAGLAVDMLVLAIWLDIDNEAYGRIVGIAYTWSLLALVILGLALAVRSPAQRVRPVWLATVAMTLIAGVLSTWLIASSSGDETSAGEEIPEGSLVGVASTDFIGDDELLRALGASLVLLASLWFGTLAADRLERARTGVTR